LFGRDKSAISRYISNVHKEKELEKESSDTKFTPVQMEIGAFL